jgi:acetolactate synthase-1/2/3 large subunit
MESLEHSGRPSATVGDVVAHFLHRCGVTAVFGVISEHNMALLDALGRGGELRFIPSRGEAGAVNMADAYARVGGGLGVAVTSTGSGAANAAGALLEARTAGTALLHLTGQISTPYLDRSKAYLHEAQDQPGMLKSLGKAAFRVWSVETVLATLKHAVQIACTAPAGPVSVEIPIDIQRAELRWPGDFTPLAVLPQIPDPAALDEMAQRLQRCRRPMLWLGGGARGAMTEARYLIELGFGAVSSVQGRGIIAEDDPRSLGAFQLHDSVERFYSSCDAMLVVGSRLRSNETLDYTLQLPQPLLQIDVDPLACNRNYAVEHFVCGDSALALAGLAERLYGRLRTGRQFHNDLGVARAVAEKMLRADLGPYSTLVDALQQAAGKDFVWVRDVTLSNTTWGSRLLKIFTPQAGVHALSDGIGQGLPMAIGAAVAAAGRRVLALVGDGGLALNLGELSSAVQERSDIVLIVMNDRGYGVIRNIQDLHYGGRRYYADLHTPNFAQLAAAVGMRYLLLDSIDQVRQQIERAFTAAGPVLLEVDMQRIGPFARTFAGPAQRRRLNINRS